MALRKSPDQAHKGLEKNWQSIERLLKCDLDALRVPLPRDFLGVLDYLRAVEPSTGRQFLDLWLQLGDATGVSERELRKEHDRERKAVQDGLVGCSWLKCAMYEQEYAGDTFMCVGCRKVMYCGPSCQDR